jgi:hypothetical protein
LRKFVGNHPWQTATLVNFAVRGPALNGDASFWSDPNLELMPKDMNLPERAMVLCVDEKSQVQALNRTQPILPMRPGIPARQFHDYERPGVTSLFAALDVKTGKTISSVHRRHRHQEFLKFPDIVDTQVPADLEIHIVMDVLVQREMERGRFLLGTNDSVCG